MVAAEVPNEKVGAVEEVAVAVPKLKEDVVLLGIAVAKFRPNVGSAVEAAGALASPVFGVEPKERPAAGAAEGTAPKLSPVEVV